MMFKSPAWALTLMLGFLLVMGLASAIICQDETSIDDVPCTVLTPVLSCSTNATVYDIANSLYYNETMVSIGSGVYNFSFNYTINSYLITLCDNTTGSIVISKSPTVFVSGAGYSAPDTNAVRQVIADEVNKQKESILKQITNTANPIWWMAFIAIVASLIVFIDYRRRKIRKIANEAIKLMGAAKK